MTLTIRGSYETANASRYLQALCRHFGHKVAVRFDHERGEVDLPRGAARLRAETARLVVDLDGDTPGDLEHGQRVIDSHLVRFAFREGFETMQWGVAVQAAS